MFSWTLHQKGSPKEHGAAVAVRHELYNFGWNTDEDQFGVQVFNTVSLRWRKLTPAVTPGTGEPQLEVPSSRYGHTAVLIGDTVYLWGGDTDQGYCNVLYAFDVNAHRWFKPGVSGAVPEERWGHSACVLGKVMFIHGGATQTGRTNDIYKLDTSTMVWSLINTRGTDPLATWCHSGTIIGTKMFVFGGHGEWEGWDKYLSTIRVFDTETNLWLKTPLTQLLPERRDGHSAFTYNGELYIFGGERRGRGLRDMWKFWKFSPETFSWKKVEPKGKHPSKMYGMCCCMVGDRVILFGADNRPGDLYVLDFSPSLKTLCKLAVIQYGLEQSGLPHNIRWELEAMTIATATERRKYKKK